MKRFIYILAILSLVMSFCVQTASSAMIGDTAQTKVDLVSVLDNPLREHLAQAAEDDVIRVTIELMDDIDLDNVELKAISRAEISMAEKAYLNAEALSLTDTENRSIQSAALKVYDKISKERNAILEEYYSAKNEAFISSTCLKDAEIGGVGLFTPFIQDVSLTKGEILNVAANPEVCRIYIVEEHHLGYFDHDDYSNRSWDYPSIDDTYKIVGGDAFINAGYTGSGIRVGLVELYHPNLSKMGSDGKNITLVNSGNTGSHPTMTSGIIKKFAPSCSIYSYALGDTTTEKEALDACDYLIKNYSVDVINVSLGYRDGTYTEYARRMDLTIRNTRVPIVVAAGNAKTQDSGGGEEEIEKVILDGRINVLGIAGNAITVGNVITDGIDPDAPGAFKLAEDSCYKETSPINKPDICAPGYVRIYSYKDCGTSFAAPHVTGTVVQMMARNAAFVSQPQKVKAALLASATRNCGESMSDLSFDNGSDKVGAGVLDSEFCYRLSRAGRAAHFDATSSSDTFTQDVYCDYTTKPFRIACTWEIAADKTGDALNVSDYDLRVFKNGVQVATSLSSVSPTSTKGTNSEIIEIKTDTLKKYGGGYYEVQISRYGSFYGTGTVRIGLAWEQD